jgi:hypothetical protein
MTDETRVKRSSAYPLLSYNEQLDPFFFCAAGEVVAAIWDAQAKIMPANDVTAFDPIVRWHFDGNI